MTLEEYIAQWNSLAFWKEFTFAKNKFRPAPSQELELADNFVWFGQFAFALQIKERVEPKDDPVEEQKWFRGKVLKVATGQIKDTLRYLQEHERIQITNERGHSFDVQGSALTDITRIVVYLGSEALPEECWQTRHYISGTAGLIHIVAAHDYLGILQTLRVPDDIRRYFRYRAEVLPQLKQRGVAVEEPDIMGAFINDETMPASGSRETLRRFVQDAEQFDLSWLLGQLHDQISASDQPYDYYRILQEFACVPRSVWREVKVRLTESVKAVREKRFARPYRLAFPNADCAFMIAPLDPELPATGDEGVGLRIQGLKNLTDAAMYDMRTSKGIGVVISKDGAYFQIDWCFMEVPWEPNAETEAHLARSYPFREARGRRIESFVLEALPGE